MSSSKSISLFSSFSFALSELPLPVKTSKTFLLRFSSDNFGFEDWPRKADLFLVVASFSLAKVEAWNLSQNKRGFFYHKKIKLCLELVFAHRVEKQETFLTCANKSFLSCMSFFVFFVVKKLRKTNHFKLLFCKINKHKFQYNLKTNSKCTKIYCYFYIIKKNLKQTKIYTNFNIFQN